MNNLE